MFSQKLEVSQRALNGCWIDAWLSHPSTRIRYGRNFIDSILSKAPHTLTRTAASPAPHLHNPTPPHKPVLEDRVTVMHFFAHTQDVSVILRCLSEIPRLLSQVQTKPSRSEFRAALGLSQAKAGLASRCSGPSSPCRAPTSSEADGFAYSRTSQVHVYMRMFRCPISLAASHKFHGFNLTRSGPSSAFFYSTPCSGAITTTGDADEVAAEVRRRESMPTSNSAFDATTLMSSRPDAASPDGTTDTDSVFDEGLETPEKVSPPTTRPSDPRVSAGRTRVSLLDEGRRDSGVSDIGSPRHTPHASPKQATAATISRQTSDEQDGAACDIGAVLETPHAPSSGAHSVRKIRAPRSTRSTSRGSNNNNNNNKQYNRPYHQQYHHQGHYSPMPLIQPNVQFAAVMTPNGLMYYQVIPDPYYEYQAWHGAHAGWYDPSYVPSGVHRPRGLRIAPPDVPACDACTTIEECDAAIAQYEYQRTLHPGVTNKRRRQKLNAKIEG